MLGAIFPAISQVIAKILPDPKIAQEAKLKLYELQLNGELAELDKVIAPFLAEAQNDDRWTSRARPSFMYVMYIMILFSIPFGILYIFDPVAAKSFGAGVQFWLAAIPKQLWDIFGVCFSVYALARTHEKQPFFGKT